VRGIDGCGGARRMVKFECEGCGASEKVNVLPGKHAVLGAAASLNRNSSCCRSPEYVDSTGFRQNMIDSNFRDFIPFRA